MNDDSFRDLMGKQIRGHVGAAFGQSIWERLVERPHYIQIDMLEGTDYESPARARSPGVGPKAITCSTWRPLPASSPA